MDPTLNDLISQILEIKEEERSINERLKTLKEQRKAFEFEVLKAMQDQGLERSGIGGANVTVMHKRFPQVKDWDALYEYIYQNNAAYILQRRVSGDAIKEIEELEGEVPGVEFYEEDQVQVRRAPQRQ